MTLIFNQTVTVTSGSSLCFKVDTNATYRIDNGRIISKNGGWLRPSLRGRCPYLLFDRRRISQTNGVTGRHHWRWAGAVPIAEYKDAVRFGDRIALAEAASRFCNCHVVADDEGQGQLPRTRREE